MHSVREFVEEAFAIVGRRIEWRGKGIDEVGIDDKDGEVLIEVDKRYFRPTEVDTLIGDASKARQQLGWRPQVSFKELVADMVQSDLNLASRAGAR
jgi:GDPmannose 4,6-dehydratase